jgi:hypothetical protein
MQKGGYVLRKGTFREKNLTLMQLYCRTDSKKRTKHYQKLCFHYVHEEVWQKFLISTRIFAIKLIENFNWSGYWK